MSIYSGDTDACVPFPATYDYFSSMAADMEPVQHWAPWNVNGQVAGVCV